MARVRAATRNRRVEQFYGALTKLLRAYQFRDRDRQTICGITITQCYALDFVVRDGPLTILEIGRRLVLDKSNASRVVESLESIGAVSRAKDRDNHRIRWISPTASGRQIHSKITIQLIGEYARMLRQFDDRFVTDVTNLLEALADEAAKRKMC
jgi:DNA-binding MarR family transcriptional regulator